MTQRSEKKPLKNDGGKRMKAIEKHHVLYPKRLWTQFESGRLLRTSPALIVPLHKGGHDRIHQELEQVPVLDTYTLDRVARDYEPVLNNPVFSIYALQTAIYQATNFNYRASKVSRMLGEVVCEALEAQVPIIKQSIAL
jgi:hypothetical protein